MVCLCVLCDSSANSALGGSTSAFGIAQSRLEERRFLHP
jgi:hypothetical protein